MNVIVVEDPMMKYLAAEIDKQLSAMKPLGSVQKSGREKRRERRKLQRKTI